MEDAHDFQLGFLAASLLRKDTIPSDCSDANDEADAASILVVVVIGMPWKEKLLEVG